MLNKKIKTIIATTVALSAFTALSAAETISLTNTFGGDNDKVSGKDFISFDKDGNKSETHISDRVQFDLASKYIDSRIRLDINGSGDLKGANPVLQIAGFVNFRPVEWLNFIAGNNFYTKWAIDGAFLSASENYPATGKLADSNGAGIVFNYAGFQGAAAIGYEADWNVNFGTAYTIKDIASFGATAQNVTKSDAASYSAYAKLLAVKNLFLDFGYSYNYAGGIIEATKHEAQFSTGYNLSNFGLTLNLDGLFGLTKKDDSSDIPLAVVFRTSYKATDNLNATAKITLLQGSATGLTTTVYPYVDYKTNFGTLRAGTEVVFNSKNGYQGINIPLSWTYKLSKSN